jgi:hypothetical protein
MTRKKHDLPWHKRHPETHLANCQAYYKENRKKCIAANIKCRLKKHYGITIDIYNQMFEDQKGYCAMCGTHQSEFKRKLSVDHNHTTGKIRGLLCTGCNISLGVYEKYKDTCEIYLHRKTE